MIKEKTDTENLVNMFEMATELQEPIWKRKKIKADSLFFIRSYNKFFRFPCDGYIYYEREDRIWWVDGIRGEVVSSQNRLVNEFLLAAGQGQQVRLFNDDPGAFYKYDDGELNFIRIYEQDELQEMLKPHYPNRPEYPFWMIDLIQPFAEWVKKKVQQDSTVPFGNPDALWKALCPPFISGKQLWLEFVMDQKYQKRWDSHRWVPIANKGGEQDV